MLPQTWRMGTSAAARSPSFLRTSGLDSRDCRRRCRKLCRIGRCPGVGVFSAPTHADERRFLREAVFLGQKGYQASHVLPGFRVAFAEM